MANQRGILHLRHPILPFTDTRCVSYTPKNKADFTREKGAVESYIVAICTWRSDLNLHASNSFNVPVILFVALVPHPHIKDTSGDKLTFHKAGEETMDRSKFGCSYIEGSSGLARPVMLV